MGGTLERIATERSDECTAHIRQLTLALHTRILTCIRKGLDLDTDPMRKALGAAIVLLELEGHKQRELIELSRRVDDVLGDVVAAGDEAAPDVELDAEQRSTCGACGEPLDAVSATVLASR